MKVETRLYDVFLSYALQEAKSADIVERALAGAGLSVFSPYKIEYATSIKDRIQQAIAESQSVVVVIDPRQAPSSNTAVEIGAALAWDKPVYVVDTGPGNTSLPDYLLDYPAYPISRIDDLVQSAKHDTDKPLSEEDRFILCDIYAELGLPADQLVMTPSALNKLTEEFNSRSKTHASQSLLARELIALRKRGAKHGGLPRISK